MTQTPVSTRPGRDWKRFLKLAGLTLLVLLLAAHFLWKRSGSNEWKLVRNDSGVEIFTLKTPGEVLLRQKVKTRVKSSLAGIVKLIQDKDSCDDVGCRDIQMFDRADLPDGLFSAYYSYSFDLPGPLVTREFVILIHHVQDPGTKVIQINTLAAPNKTPRSVGVVRVSRMNNIWTLVPTGTGYVDIEFVQEFDLGGSMPYFVQNAVSVGATYKNFSSLQALLDKDKFRNAQVDYVEEL